MAIASSPTLAALERITALISTSSPPERVRREITQAFARMLPRCAAWFLVEVEGALRVTEARGRRAEQVRELRLPSGECLWWRCWREQESLLLSPEELPAQGLGLGQLTHGRGQALLVLPVTGNDGPLGLFCCLLDPGTGAALRLLGLLAHHRLGGQWPHLRVGRDSLRRQLAELHHRTRNSLAAVVGLLESKRGMPGLTVDELIADTSSRVQAIAATHELLGEQAQGGEVELRATLSRVCTLARQSHGREAVLLEVEGPAVMVPAAAGLSLALAVHELVVNALKHGLLAVPDPRLRVSLAAGEEELTLSVVDNGVGFSAPPPASGRLGLGLVRGLVEEGLGGRLQVARLPQGGTAAAIAIPWPPAG